SKLENSLRDDSKLYNSDRFARSLIVYMRGAILFQLIHPFLRNYVPYFKNKINDVLESRDYILKTLNNMIEKRNSDFTNIPQKL
ncbi:9513_t:CDS:1, partial [Dentiscutata erythropus]